MMSLLLSFLAAFVGVGIVLVALLFGVVFVASLYQRMRWLTFGETPVDDVGEMLRDFIDSILESQRVSRIVAQHRRYS